MRNNTTPTLTTYTEWQTAYDFFNKELFGGQLPECIITIDNKSKRTMGYFVLNRYRSENGEVSDRLSMNPLHFHCQTLMESLSTLVHEMCHVWEFHFSEGKSYRTYHTKVWGSQMQPAGLMPSNTGEPGGAKTGQQMTHYVIDGGLFEESCKRLLADNLKISWGESGTLSSVNNLPKGKKRNKVKYSCGSCGAAVWGKPSLR